MIRRPSLSILSRLSPLVLVTLSLCSVLVPSVAQADPAPQPCDQSTYYCVDTTTPNTVPAGPLSLTSSFANLDLTNGLDTGWLPKCDPGVEHCGSAQFRFQADLSDTKIDLSMIGDIDLYWGEENGVAAGKLLACPRALNNGGKFGGTFSMSPTIGFYLDVGFANPFEFEVDPFELSGLLGFDSTIPASFDFAAAGDTTFTPWAYAPGVSVPLTGDLQPLITLPLTQIGDDIFGTNISSTLDFGINLVGGTTDTKFTWVTDSMTLAVGSHPYPVSKDNPCALIDFEGGSSIKITTQLHGTFSYSGNVSLQPQFELNAIAGFPLHFTYDIDVGADLPFGTQIPNLSFPQGAAIPKTFPLPNLFVQTGDTLSFGKVEIGQVKTKTIDIVNNGKLLSIGNVSSSEPGMFTITTDSDGDDSFQVNEDGGTDTISIAFLAQDEGPISATLTISSNDPDEPVKTVTLSATGKLTGEGGDGGTGGDDSGGSAGHAGTSNGSNPQDNGVVTQDGGCCRVAGPGEEKDSQRAATLLGLLGLGIVVARRRRGGRPNRPSPS